MKYRMNNKTIALVLTVALGACTDRQAGLAEYHEALALMEQGDAPSALERLEQAEQRAQTDSLRALVKSQMGTLYFSQRLLDRSLESYRQAYDIDQRACDTVGLIYDLRDIGNVLRATGNDSCLLCFEQARTLAVASGNLPMQRDVESQMAAYHLYHNHLEEARQLLMPALEYIDEASRSGLYYMLADYYARSGQRDSAIHYYNILLSEGNIYARQASHRVLAEYALNDGHNEQALFHLRQYELLTDSVHQANDAEAVRHTAALYDYSHHQRQAARLQRIVILAVAALIVLVAVLAALFFYFSRRRMHYRLKLERLESLLAERNRLSSEEEDSKAPSPLHPILTRLQQLTADPSQPILHDDEWAEIEEAANRLCPDFLHRIGDFCRLTAQERRVCLLLKLGIAPAGIAQLTAHTKQAVTNTRSRLYQKAFGQNGTPAQLDEFVLSLQ